MLDGTALIYRYDGSFYGFLSCVYEYYYSEKNQKPDQIEKYEEEGYEFNFTHDFVNIETDEKKALKVYSAIRNKISASAAEMLYTAFLSDLDNKEKVLLEYIKKLFKYNKDISNNMADETAAPVIKAAQRVSRESHKLKGFVRFSESKEGFLFSVINPTTDCLELLGSHFADRYKRECFVIFDKCRKKALIYRPNSYTIQQFDDIVLPDKADNEAQFQDLWRQFFKTIAIKERTNPRCQRSFMPKKYWDNLTEMQPFENKTGEVRMLGE